MEDPDNRTMVDTETEALQCLYIVYDDFEWEGERTDRALTCKIKSVRDLSEATLCLKDLWADEGLVRKGTHVGIVGVTMDSRGIFLIDKRNGYLIVEPDSLVSITSVVSAYFCDRKTVFNERIRLPVNNRFILEGVIGHEMIGRAMLLEPCMRTRSQVQTIAWHVVHSSGVMLQAFGLGLTSDELTLMANSLINYVLTFLHDRCDAVRGETQSLKIQRVVDIEDTIWSPTFGLKGKLDAIVETGTDDRHSYLSPLELKIGHIDPRNRTGKIEHVGQVQLYSLLMRERYENVTSGLLYYLRPNTWIESKMERSFLQPLLIARNRIVISKKLLNGTFVNLPRASVNPNFCVNCEHRTTCALLTRTRLLESLEDYKNVTEDALITSMYHLSIEEIQFFRSWFTVITAETEASEAKHNLRSLWTKPAHEREKTGRCVTNLVFVSAMNVRPVGYDGVFAKFSLASYNRINFVKLEFQPQDLVILSTKKDICLMYGIIESIHFPDIIVRLERVSSRFTGTLEERCLIVIDKVESSSPMAIQYGYLQGLMTNSEEATRLRKYIIKKEKSNYPSIAREEILRHGQLKAYNRNQREVIVNAIRTDSFLFVKGMPGTGKTKTIVAILSLLTRMGKSVLVTAYTRSAVDNILMHCFKENLDCFIRIGEPKIRHHSIIQRMDKTIIEYSVNFDKMKSAFTDTPIVATTLLNLKHEIFQVRRFDYVIVDEASQALPSAVFGALLLAEKYILVGDPDQLPTILLTSATSELGLPDNLFTMMATADNTKTLTEQYRMNEEIMRLSNQLVYSGRMICSPKVAVSRLRIQPELIRRHVRGLSRAEGFLMERVLSPELEHSVVFVNTSEIHTFEQKLETTVVNKLEAHLVLQICKSLLQVGVKASRIGIIAPYRGQVNLISRSVHDVPQSEGVEINTVDQYQGRAKDIIICSFTKTHPSMPDGIGDPGMTEKRSILEDIRRLNVALTRAKIKLIMVGDVMSLCTYQPLGRLFQIIRFPQTYSFGPVEENYTSSEESETTASS